MLQVLAKNANKLKYLVNENSTTILTALGVAGTVSTAVLTGRATFKAAEIISKEAQLLNLYDDSHSVNADQLRVQKFTTTDKIKLVWKHYLPPVASGVLTVTCIIASNKISSKKIAALTIAGGISERALQEYKEKVVEKLGPRQDQKLRDDIAQDRVANNPPGEVVIVGDGKVLCYDMFTGRYFQSSMEDIKRAENRVNYELVNHMSASLSFFYEELGLAPTTFSDMVGWNADNRLEVLFSTVMSEDQRPCIAIDFSKAPFAEYDKIYG